MKRGIFIAIKVVVLLLLLVFVVGLSIQLFAPDGRKVTDWVEKSSFVEVGDKIKVLYVKPPDIYGAYPELTQALISLDWSNATTFGGGVGQQLVLVAFASKDTAVQEIYLYATRTKSYGGNNTTGWASYGLSVSYNWNILDYGDGQLETELNAYPMTVTAVYQQEIWKDVISKKPF